MIPIYCTAADARIAFLFHIEHSWPRAAEYGRCLAKPFSFASTLALFIFSAVAAFAQVNVPVTDSHIEYVGRWDKSNSSAYHSYWGGAYLRVSFTGTTVGVKEASAVDFWADIDGAGYNYFRGAAGTVNVTASPLGNGPHQLTVVPAWEGNELQIQGLMLSSGAATLAPANPNKPLIEFIGDSITCGLKTSKEEPVAYGWLVSEWLNCNHTQIAYSGITLVDGYHYTYAGAPLRGQSVQYFWMQEPNQGTAVNWNFADYTPRVVVINLGSNDSFLSVPSATFETAYLTFLQNIRARLPNATIIALEPFGAYYATNIQNAVNNRHIAGDQNVVYVSTAGWISSSDTYDGTHPTEAGHQKIANYLGPILNAYLPNAIANGTYKIVDVPGYALEDPASGGDGTLVDQNTYNSGLNQQWVVTQVTGNQCKITCAANGLALGGANWQVALHPYTGAPSQLWTFQPDGSYYNLINVGSGQALDDWSGGLGRQVISYAVDSTNPNQKWTLSLSAAPATPVGLNATATNMQIRLTWNASSGATGYNLKRSTTNGGTCTLVSSLAATNYADSTVANGCTYYYVVSATNILGESTNSSQVSATMPKVMIAMGAQTNGQFNVTCQGASNQTYVFENSTNLTLWTPLLTNTPVNGLFNYTATNLTDPKRFYRIRQ